MSQGVPNYPPAPQVVRRLVEIAQSDNGGGYTPRMGLPELRAAFAAELRTAYGGDISPENVLITAGCSQAFSVVSATLTECGDEVATTSPYYFDHARWLRLDQARPLYFDCDATFAPSVTSARRALTARTRGIVLTTPANPTGVSVSGELLDQFADLAAEAGIALILDETYRSFGPTDAAHGLFRRSDWSDTVVSLHSFSKDFAIPGFRVGAVVGSPELIAQALKLHSCAAICAPRAGQEAALAGLLEAQGWRESRVAEMQQKLESFRVVMASQPAGFELVASGAFFGWVRHPFVDEPTDQVVRRLLRGQGVHVLPGTAFMGADDRYMRFSFANLTVDEIGVVGERLEAYSCP